MWIERIIVVRREIWGMWDVCHCFQRCHISMRSHWRILLELEHFHFNFSKKSCCGGNRKKKKACVYALCAISQNRKRPCWNRWRQNGDQLRVIAAHTSTLTRSRGRLDPVCQLAWPDDFHLSWVAARGACTSACWQRKVSKWMEEVWQCCSRLRHPRFTIGFQILTYYKEGLSVCLSYPLTVATCAWPWRFFTCL